MRSRAAVALALAAVAAVLAPMLAIGFLNDDHLIVDFALHRGRPLLAALLSRAEVIEVYYRPLFDLTLALDHRVWGWTPLGFRLTNLALHLANTLLVHALARRLGLDRVAALAALLLFGLHPIHETSLYWIAGRTDVLCATFMLGSLLLAVDALRTRRAAMLAASLALCLLAMLSKEMALTLPLLVGVTAHWLARDRSPRERMATAVRASWPYAAVIAGVLLVRLVALDNNLFDAAGVHGGVPALQLVRNLATYLGLLAIPAGHEEIESVLRARPALFAGLALVALGVGGALLLRWRRSLGPLLFCSALLLVSLLPVLRLMMRWYLYIPSVFFALGVGWLLAELWRRRRRAAMVAIGALAIAYAAIDVVTIGRWVDASVLAAGLGGDLRAELADVRPGDTLRFATIPGKLGSVPIFNLGFAGTVRHLLGEDSLTVVYASKLNMPAYPTEVATTAGAGTVSLAAAAGASFGLTATEIIAQQRTAGSGESVVTELGAVRIASTGADRRPTAIAISLRPAGPRARTLSFDGRRFVRLDGAK